MHANGRRSMGEPERPGEIIDFAALREKFRGLARDPAEIAEQRDHIERMQRQGRQVGPNLAKLVDWPAIVKPDRLREDTYAREGLAWMRGYKVGEPGACIWGPKGTGKTTLCCHLLRRLEDCGYTVALVSAPALVRALVAGRFVYADLVREIAAVDALVLDDMGADTWENGWGGHLRAIADARWQGRSREGVTILTTNIHPGTPAFGWIVPPREAGDWERAIDRLEALAPRIIEYAGPSRRHVSIDPESRRGK